MHARMNGQHIVELRKRQRAPFAHSRLDFRDDPQRFVMLTMDREPAGTFRHVAAREEHDKSEQRADEEAGAPADVDRKEFRIEQDQRRHRSQRRADPIAAVDAEIYLSAHAGRNQLIDGGIDRRIFAADAKSGDDPAKRHARKIPRERSRQRSDQIDSERCEEELGASVPIGQMAAHQGADHGTGQVKRTESADLLAIEMERLRMLKDAADGARQCDFQSVDCPARTECKHDEPVETAPWQSIEPSGNVGTDGRHRNPESSTRKTTSAASTEQRHGNRGYDAEFCGHSTTPHSASSVMTCSASIGSSCASKPSALVKRSIF